MAFPGVFPCGCNFAADISICQVQGQAPDSPAGRSLIIIRESAWLMSAHSPSCFLSLPRATQAVVIQVRSRISGGAEGGRSWRYLRVSRTGSVPRWGCGSTRSVGPALVPWSTLDCWTAAISQLGLCLFAFILSPWGQLPSLSFLLHFFHTVHCGLLFQGEWRPQWALERKGGPG